MKSRNDWTFASRAMPLPRRRFVGGALASALAAPALIIPGKAETSGRRVVAVNFGGAMGEAKRTVVYAPFTRETGIEVISVPGPDLAKLKLQVQSGNVEWDVVDLLPGWVPLATRLGLLERIDDSIVNRTNCIAPARNEFAVAGAIATSGIGFTSDRFGQHVPKTWAEFWNVGRFPGRRGLDRRIVDTLEIALMADGVPAHQIYPCDIDRAFRSLDRIKPSINHWIAQTEQSVSLIQQDETDFTYTFSTRVRNMQAAGAHIGFSPKQNLLSVSWSGIVKGAPNRDAAMRLCSYIADPVRQVALSNLTGDTPVYLDAVRRVTPATSRWLPDLTSSDNLFVNAEWWNGKLDELTLRFQDWLFS